MALDAGDLDWLESRFSGIQRSIDERMKGIHNRFNDLTGIAASGETKAENAQSSADKAHERIDHLMQGKAARSYSPPEGTRAQSGNRTTTLEIGESTRRWIWAFAVALGLAASGAGGAWFGSTRAEPPPMHAEPPQENEP